MNLSVTASYQLPQPVPYTKPRTREKLPKLVVDVQKVKTNEIDGIAPIATMTQNSGPYLGSDFLKHAPTTPEGLPTLTPTLCSNISNFKSLLAQYRRLDDSIVMRLNRAHALSSRDPK